MITNEQFPFEGGYFGHIDVGDYNCDGLMDLLITGRINDTIFKTRLIKNNGGLQFETISTSFPNVSLGNSQFADLDNDGDLDVIISGDKVRNDNKTKVEGILRFYENIGNDHFILFPAQFPQLYHSNLQTGDFDTDGDLDFIYSGITDDLYVRTYVYFNDGANSFIQTQELTGVYYAKSGLIDLDQDNDDDFVITGLNSSGEPALYFYLNDDGVLSNAGVFPDYGVSLGDLEVIDIDFDNDMDLMISGQGLNDNTFVITFDGFDFEITPMSFPNIHNGDFDFGDFTGDRKPDLLFSGTITDTTGGIDGVTYFYENTSTDTLVKPNTPINLRSSVQGNKVEIGWVRNSLEGVTYNVEVYNALGECLTTRVSDSLDVLKMKGFLKGNASMNDFFILKNLDKGIYRCRVQAISVQGVSSDFSAFEEFEITEDLENSIFEVENMKYWEDNGLSASVFLLRDVDFDGDLDIQYNSRVIGTNSYKSGVLKNTGFGRSFQEVNEDINLSFPVFLHNSFVQDDDSSVLNAMRTSDFYYDYSSEGQEIYYPDGDDLYKVRVSEGDYTGVKTMSENAQKVFFGNGFGGYKLTLFEYMNYDDFLNTNERGTLSYVDYYGNTRTISDYTLTNRNPLFDINGDNIDDLLTISGIYFNTGEDFELKTHFPNGLIGKDWNDVDSDGLMDVTFGNPNYFYHNLGNNVFKLEIINGQLPSYAYWGNMSSYYIDINNDSRNDLILASEDYIVGNDTVGFFRVYLNSEEGFFDSLVYAHDDIILSDLEFGDLNGDGTLDILYSWYDDDGENEFESTHGVVCLYSKTQNNAPTPPSINSFSVVKNKLAFEFQSGVDDNTISDGLKIHIDLKNADGDLLFRSGIMGNNNVQAHYYNQRTFSENQFVYQNIPEGTGYSLSAYSLDGQNKLSSSSTQIDFDVAYLDRSTIVSSEGDLNLLLIANQQRNDTTEIIYFETTDDTSYFSIQDNSGNILFKYGLDGVPDALSFVHGDFNRDGLLDYMFNTKGDSNVTHMYLSDGNGFSESTYTYYHDTRFMFYGNIDEGLHDWLYLFDYNKLGGGGLTKAVYSVETDGFYAQPEIIPINSQKFMLFPRQLDIDNDGFLELIGVDGYNNMLIKTDDYIRRVPQAYFLSLEFFDFNGDGQMEVLMNDGINQDYILNFGDDFEPFPNLSQTTDLGPGNFTHFSNIDFFNTGIPSFTNFELLGELNMYQFEFKRLHKRNLLNFKKDKLLDLQYADLNQDHVIDALYVTKETSRNALSKGLNVETTNSLPSAPENLQAIVTENKVLLKWDNGIDKETPNDLLSYDIQVYDSDGNIVRNGNAFDDGQRIIYKTGDFRTNKASFKNVHDGTYTWKVQCIDGQMQGSEWSVIDSFMVQVEPEILGDTIVCEHDIVSFQVKPLEYQYDWSIDSNIAQIVALDTINNVVDIELLKSGKLNLIAKHVTYELVDTLFITVLQNPTPSFESQLVSAASKTLFEFHPVDVDQEVSAYNWEFLDFDSTIADANPQFDFKLFDDYGVKMTVDYENGCLNTVENNLKVRGPNIVGNDTVCIGEKNGFRVYPVGYKYVWESSGGNLTLVNESEGLISIEYPDTGRYELTVFNTDPEINAADSMWVTVVDSSRSSFTIPEDISIDAEVTFVNTSTGADQYQWTVDGYSSNEFNLNYEFSSIGNYTVQLLSRNTFGCTSVMSQSVFVSEELEILIYNAVSANGDGENDFLFIENIERYPDNKVSVYTMNGKLIYEQESYNNTWDFTIDGEIVSSGNYICIVEVDGFSEVVNQVVTVVK